MAPKKRKAVSTEQSTKPSPATIAANFIKTKLKKSPIEETHGQLPHFASGSFLIDDLIGGVILDTGEMKCPGYPRRRMIEIFGPESSGKTTIALAAIVQVQKAGGCAMFLDYEHSLDHDYARKIGVSFDKEKLIVYEPDTLEEGFNLMLVACKAGIDLIVVDSVAAMTPKAAKERSVDDAALVGAQAAKLSLLLPRLNEWLATSEGRGTSAILLNQMRSKIGGTGYGDDDNTTGGKAIRFYAYLRLKFSLIKKETLKGRNLFTGLDRPVPYGALTNVKVIKSKVDGKAGQSATIFLRYNKGLDDLYSLVESAAATRVIKKKSASQYVYQGVEYRGREKVRRFLAENPEEAEKVKAAVLAAVRSASVEVTEEEEQSDDFDLNLNLGGDDEGDDDAEAEVEEVEADDDAAAAE